MIRNRTPRGTQFLLIHERSGLGLVSENCTRINVALQMETDEAGDDIAGAAAWLVDWLGRSTRPTLA